MDKLDYRYTLLARKVDMKLGKIFVICKNLEEEIWKYAKKKKEADKFMQVRRERGSSESTMFSYSIYNAKNFYHFKFLS